MSQIYVGGYLKLQGTYIFNEGSVVTYNYVPGLFQSVYGGYFKIFS
jgi:hypothetical protein